MSRFLFPSRCWSAERQLAFDAFIKRFDLSNSANGIFATSEDRTGVVTGKYGTGVA